MQDNPIVRDVSGKGVGAVKVRFLFGTLLLTLVLHLLTGCGILKKDPPTIASLTLTDKVDERRKSALIPRTSFPRETREFFASVQVLNPRKGTIVKAEWYFERKLVDESDVTFDVAGDRYVAFNLVTASNKPFPNGPYKVKIFLDGKMTHEMDFRVE